MFPVELRRAISTSFLNLILAKSTLNSLHQTESHLSSEDFMPVGSFKVIFSPLYFFFKGNLVPNGCENVQISFKISSCQLWIGRTVNPLPTGSIFRSGIGIPVDAPIGSFLPM